MENPTLTYGQKLVGINFNVTGNADVQNIKEFYAKVIDGLNNARTTTESQEQHRLYSIAITETQTAQMWAVKAITWKD